MTPNAKPAMSPCSIVTEGGASETWGELRRPEALDAVLTRSLDETELSRSRNELRRLS